MWLETVDPTLLVSCSQANHGKPIEKKPVQPPKSLSPPSLSSTTEVKHKGISCDGGCDKRKNIFGVRHAHFTSGDDRCSAHFAELDPSEQQNYFALEQPQADRFGADTGIVIQVKGLYDKPELNGHVGTIDSWDGEKSRYSVKLGGQKLLIKPRNLMKLPEVPATQNRAQARWPLVCSHLLLMPAGSVADAGHRAQRRPPWLDGAPEPHTLSVAWHSRTRWRRRPRCHQGFLKLVSVGAGQHIRACDGWRGCGNWNGWARSRRRLLHRKRRARLRQADATTPR